MRGERRRLHKSLVQQCLREAVVRQEIDRILIVGSDAIDVFGPHAILGRVLAGGRGGPDRLGLCRPQRRQIEHRATLDERAEVRQLAGRDTLKDESARGAVQQQQPHARRRRHGSRLIRTARRGNGNFSGTAHPERHARSTHRRTPASARPPDGSPGVRTSSEARRRRPARAHRPWSPSRPAACDRPRPRRASIGARGDWPTSASAAATAAAALRYARIRTLSQPG